MSIKISIQNKPGLSPWTLADLLLIVRQFHCHASIHNGEIMIDGKNRLEAAAIRRPELSKMKAKLNGGDENKALDYIRNSRVGRFITQSK
jgi:hypothetical protein